MLYATISHMPCDLMLHKALSLCVLGRYEELGDWWSQTVHPDAVLGVPEYRGLGCDPQVAP